MPVDPKREHRPTRFSIAKRVCEIVAQALPWKPQETSVHKPHDVLAQLSECRAAAADSPDVLGELESLISAARNDYEAEFAILQWANLAVQQPPEAIEDIPAWCRIIAPTDWVYDDAQIAPGLPMDDVQLEENKKLGRKIIEVCAGFGIYHDLAVPPRKAISRAELATLAHHLSAAAVKVIRESSQQPPIGRPAIDNPITTPESFPAEHYKAKFGIEPNTLNKAQRSGRIVAEKRSGRWFYRIDEVRQLYPDAFTERDET